jgi:antitoxin component HigA of HigAB toxin-antitoxin module
METQRSGDNLPKMHSYDQCNNPKIRLQLDQWGLKHNDLNENFDSECELSREVSMLRDLLNKLTSMQHNLHPFDKICPGNHLK